MSGSPEIPETHLVEQGTFALMVDGIVQKRKPHLSFIGRPLKDVRTELAGQSFKRAASREPNWEAYERTQDGTTTRIALKCGPNLGKR